MEKIQYRNASISVVISLLSGIFIISGSLILLGMVSWHGSTLIMGGPWHMYKFTYPQWLTALMTTTSLLAGGLVLIASYKMYKEPNNRLWGLLIILGSVVSLLGIGGFGLGGVLGLIGGLTGLSRGSQRI